MLARWAAAGDAGQEGSYSTALCNGQQEQQRQRQPQQQLVVCAWLLLDSMCGAVATSTHHGQFTYPRTHGVCGV
jgi:hypothetical protein